MYGVEMGNPGAQAYYNSVFALFASWGVDYVKVDDISRPYHEHEPEIEAIRKAIDKTERPTVLSLSPGATALTAAEHRQPAREESAYPSRARAACWRLSSLLHIRFPPRAAGSGSPTGGRESEID